MFVQAMKIAQRRLRQPLTQRIFLTQKAVGFGRPRLLLAVVTMRGMSSSATAIRATTVRTTSILFG